MFLAFERFGFTVRRMPRWASVLGALSLPLLAMRPSSACDGFVAPVGAAPYVPRVSCPNCHPGLSQTPPPERPFLQRTAFATAWAQACTGCDTTTPAACGVDCVSARIGVFPDLWDNCSIKYDDTDEDGFNNDEELSFGTDPGVPGDVNECVHGADCVLGAECSDPGRNAKGNYTCACPGAGFEGDGRRSGSGCVDVDECARELHDCTDPNSVCRDTEGSFDCECVPGTFGSGHAGQGCTVENACEGDPCDPLSTCIAAVGSFSCHACLPGYIGNPVDCPACPPGYAGDGARAGSGCDDVRECAPAAASCYPGVTCQETEGGFRCGACPSGYQGSGVGANGCTHDECSTCSPFAHCVLGGAAPRCECNVGYTGDGQACADVDECERNLATCAAPATCVNLPGGYLCSCGSGLRAVDGRCDPVTCENWGLDCGDGARCDDTGGDPQCICTSSSLLPPAKPGPSSGEPGAGHENGTPGAPGLQALRARWSALPSTVAGALGLLVLCAGLRRRRTASALVRRYAPSLTLLLVALASLLQGSGCSETSSGAAPVVGDVPAQGGSSTIAAGGSGGVEPLGMGGSSQPLDCNAPDAGALVTTCSHSRECNADRWCNPATHACQLRDSGEATTFRDITLQLRSVGCTNCHLPGGEGVVDPSGVGAVMILDDKENFQQAYANLVYGGVSCQGGLRRVCVDDPASSRLVTMVLDTGDNVSQKSIAFTSWADDGLQKILRWIARGAPRDPSCGNYQVDPGEICDEGPAPNARCTYGTASCQLCTAQCVYAPATGPTCGDGTLDALFEQCDDGNNLVETVGPNGGPTCGRLCTFEAGNPAGG